MARYTDLTGKLFGRLTVVDKAPSTITPSGHKLTRWFCKCSCGNIVNVNAQSLTKGVTISCGCYHSEIASKRWKRYNKYDFLPSYVIGYTSKGMRFFIDYQDYDVVSKYCWYEDKDGYLTTGSGSNGTAIRLHVLIMGKPEKGYVIDHINHDPKDNRRCNLRVVTQSMNNANSGMCSNNTSGVTGVCWESNRKKWRVMIGVNNKKIFLGRFNSFEDAVKVRKEAENKYFGMFSYENSNNLVPSINEGSVECVS